MSRYHPKGLVIYEENKSCKLCTGRMSLGFQEANHKNCFLSPSMALRGQDTRDNGSVDMGNSCVFPNTGFYSARNHRAFLTPFLEEKNGG